MTLRADAERNRRLVLDAAATAFAEQGLDAGVADIARRAGVGNATVFRRFRTKEDLVLAVLEDRLAALRDAARDASRNPDSATALRSFFEAAIAWQTDDMVCLEALSEGLFDHPRFREIRAEVYADVEAVVERAHEAGTLRRDVTVADLKFLSAGVAQAVAPVRHALPELWRRYLGIVLDGLKPSGASPLEAEAPDLAELERAFEAAASATFCDPWRVHEPVIVGFDAKDAARRALDRGIEEARGRNGTLLVLAVEELPLNPTDPMNYGTLDDGPVSIGLPETPEVEAMLAEARERVEPSGVDADYLWAAGDPARAMVDLAKDRAAGAIVIGSHHHGLFGRLFGLDVEDDLKKHAGCDVIVVE